MYSKEEAYLIIEKLVKRFSEQIDSYKSGAYNETLTRRDFIDPFFKALGWDVDNSQGYAEAYREVIHEDRVKVGGGSKAPDYSFRLPGGKRLFFVEAKKPSILVKDDISVAYQVRRYGWNAKLAISLVTDFEELAVYDCSKKPNPTDKPGIARIKYLTYSKYLDEFDYLWDAFSKERVLKGGFDRYIQSDSVKKGTATVDKEFLLSLDKWRTELAISISLKNKQLDEDEINFVVQLTIDRLIFLRIAEDRGVEPYGQLHTSIIMKGNAWQNLFFNFKKADEKYNSGLFDFKKDLISEKLVVDNKIIKNIVNDMYFPCPYVFSEIPVEILGSVYEQFLGKQIRIDTAHHATIEEKPEVRKAGGVYYTPQYIVEYIVKNTVGELIEGKTPKQVEKLKIVDPACGSGSFLIGAYQYLLDYHKNYYTGNGTRTGKRDSPITPAGNLTSAGKKRILLNNIYGVDIDLNAVEVTKLSLLLKCMEGETETSLAQQYQIWHERILPTLDNNIKCGNSLIDIDYYDGQLDFEPGTEKKVKPFNWRRAFPEVFKPSFPEEKANLKELAAKARTHAQKALEYTTQLENKLDLIGEQPAIYGTGGFDVVIGNPPYGALLSVSELAYFKSSYKTSVWRGESYLLFIESALKLLKTNGFLGYIIPDTLLNLGFTSSSRAFLLQNSLLNELVLLPSNIFSGATVDTILLFAQKSEPASTFHPNNVSVAVFDKKRIIQQVIKPDRSFVINTESWYDQNAFNLQSDLEENKLVLKLGNSQIRIGNIVSIYSGIKAYEVGKGKPPQTEEIRVKKPFTSSLQLSNGWKPFYDGKHIGRYQLLWKGNNWINYGEWLAAPRNAGNFEGEKILIRKIIGKTLIANYIPYTSYCNTLLFVLKINNDSYSYPALTGVLNSSLIGWYFRKKLQISDSDTFPQIMIRDILEFPVPALDNQSGREVGSCVDLIMKLYEELQSARLPDKIEQLKVRIEHTDNKIDRLVYQLYGLTEDEIELLKKS